MCARIGSASRRNPRRRDGEHAEAASLYAVAAGRWHRFTGVLEEAYALLGQGRCLTIVGDPEANAPFQAARRLFDRLVPVPHRRV